ncbi:MAG TPA: hypothetical protein VN616_11625 [Puia sp.]|nr:hypothetical protein [Puia sp.]
MSRRVHHYTVLTVLFLFVAAHPSIAQSKVSWSDQFKMHKGSSGISIVYADNSGIYLQETHDALKTYFVVGATVRGSATLVKLDPLTMSERYRSDFDKELKGKEFSRLFFIRDKLYLFATEYSSKDLSLNLYAVAVDKANGSLTGDWQKIYSWQKEDKSEDIDFQIAPNSDSSRIILTGTYTGRAQNRYEIKMMDANLQPLGKPITITNEFDPKTFQVERFEYTSFGNAILVGRVYQYAEGKKKKDRNLEFLNYNIRLYNPQGKMIRDIKTDIDGKFLVNSKVIQSGNELILAAFYSDEKKRKEVDGLLVERLDPATGNILVSTKQELDRSKVTQVQDDGDAPKKSGDEEEEHGLTGNIVFRSFYVAPDNGLVILAEKFRREIVTTYNSMQMMGPGNMYHNSSSTYANYHCEDIYMVKVSPGGQIDWLHDLPKNQLESVPIGGSSGNSMGPSAGFGPSYNYFVELDARPFYAGFGSIAGKSKIHIFFNDTEDNASVLQPGGRIRRTSKFAKSSCYEVDLDMLTGKYSRKPLFTNRNIPISMPRLGVALNDILYLTGIEDRSFAKSKIIVGTIACTD